MMGNGERRGPEGKERMKLLRSRVVGEDRAAMLPDSALAPACIRHWSPFQKTDAC